MKSKKSKKSLKKRKTTKSKEKAKVKKENTIVVKDTVPHEEEVKFNDTGFGGFQFNANAQADATSNNGAAVDV